MRIGSTSLHVNFPSLSSPRGNNQRCTILVNETLAKPIEVPNCLRCQHPWRLESPQVIYLERSFRVFRDSECLTSEIPWWFWFVHIWYPITCKSYFWLSRFFPSPKVVSFNTEYGYDKMYINGRPFSCSVYHFCCPPFPVIVANESIYRNPLLWNNHGGHYYWEGLGNPSYHV